MSCSRSRRPVTTADVDGDECLHDCDTCTIHLPRSFKIDKSNLLFGKIKGWSRHLVVATGKTGWVRDVADEKCSVMEAIEKHNGEVQSGRLMLSASTWSCRTTTRARMAATGQ